MKLLFIGGTGTISTAISKKLLEQGHDLYLLNRGNRNLIFPECINLHEIKADINNGKQSSPHVVFRSKYKNQKHLQVLPPKDSLAQHLPHPSASDMKYLQKS